MSRKPLVYNIIMAVIGLLILIITAMIIFINPVPKTSRKVAGISNKMADAPSKPVFRKDGELSFLDGKTGNKIITVEIEVADDYHEREQGLMYRDTMAENAGMLFLMEAEEPQAFWMKNTIIPLDILYAGSDHRIVSIHKNCKPYSLDQIESGKPALYVVEVNAGYTSKYGIRVGDRISF